MTIEMLLTYWPVIIGGVIVLIALVLLLRRRGQRVELGSVDPILAPTLARTATIDTVVAPRDIPIAAPPLVGEPDNLLQIKGLGPKVAVQLGTLGIVRFDQLAALDHDAQAALDAQLGTFAGRMARDRWIEQAALLARNDVAGFEAQFGKLG